MLTADGTRLNDLAAAENDPRSSTAKKTSTLSLEKLISHLSEKMKGTDFLYQAAAHKVQIPNSLKGKIMQGIKRKIVFIGLYELIAIPATGAGLSAASGQGGETAGALGVAACLIAILWNLMFNNLFEMWERGQAKKGRSLNRRLAHALGFEAGLIAMLVPLFAWGLNVTLWHALLMDLGLVAFFLVFTFTFNWVFDRVFGLPASAAHGAA